MLPVQSTHPMFEIVYVMGKMPRRVPSTNTMLVLILYFAAERPVVDCPSLTDRRALTTQRLHRNTPP